MRNLLIAIFAISIFLPANAEAKSKPWDVARYSDCTFQRPYDALDSIITVSSEPCERDSQADYKWKTAYRLNAYSHFSGMKEKGSSNEWRFYLAVNVDYKKVSDLSGSIDYKAISFDSATFLVNGKIVSRDLDLSKLKQDDCITYRRSGMSSTECKFRERLGLRLEASEIAFIKSVQDPDSLTVRLSSKDGESIDIKVYGEDLVAVVKATESARLD